MALCPVGFDMVGLSCIKLLLAPVKSWDQAENYCQANWNGHLASVKDEEMKLKITQMVTMHRSCMNYLTSYVLAKRHAPGRIYFAKYII